jgi:two-component system sensor histidine kinase ChvG
LSISREIVRAHGGEIIAENRYEDGAAPGANPAGARFIVRLPIAERTQRGGAPVGRRG